MSQAEGGTSSAVPTPGGREARSAPTIYDIAQLAGVNPSTVSRALSKPGRISPATEELVRNAARELGYRVNPMARALPTGRTSTLGMIVADITNPMFFEVVRGAERAAAAEGYTLILAESQESAEREAETARRVATSVDALVLATTRLSDEQIRSLHGDKPLVVINRRVDGVDSVVPLLRPGIEEALDHLDRLGHRSLAFASGPAASWMNRARWEELEEGASRRGMSLVRTAAGSPTLDGGRACLTDVLAAQVSAVFAYNDLMAIGLLRTALAAGVRVPGHLSIVGFDDIFGADFTSPPLTTIATPLRSAGECAVRQVLTRVSGDGERNAPRVADVMRTRLIVRGSTGPVGHGSSLGPA